MTRWICTTAGLLSIALLSFSTGCTVDPMGRTGVLAANAGDDRMATIDDTLMLTAMATGGTPPYQFRWIVDDTPDGVEIEEIPNSTEATIETLPFATGRYVYRVVATDSVGATDEDFVVIEVAASFGVTISRVDDGPDEPGVNETVSLSAQPNVSRDVTYEWRVADGAGVALRNESSATVDVVACAAGNVTLEVSVADPANGESVVGSFSMTFAGGDRPRVSMMIASDTPGVSGEVVFELFADAAPLTIANLFQYIDTGFYDGVVWHRVAQNQDGNPFVVQTGGFIRDGESLAVKDPPFDPAMGEPDNGFSNLPGTLGMALRGNPADSDSGTSQFFVNLDDNSFLDDRFTVFGRVDSGMDIVNAMSLVDTETTTLDNGTPLTDVPSTDVVIESFSCAFEQ